MLISLKKRSQEKGLIMSEKSIVQEARDISWQWN